jgi:hypothetical protein
MINRMSKEVEAFGGLNFCSFSIHPDSFNENLHFAYIRGGKIHRKRNALAKDILCDVISWYRPRTIKDESTGRPLEQCNRFKGKFLEKCKTEFAAQFYEDERAVDKAFQLLAAYNLITTKESRRQRNPTPGNTAGLKTIYHIIPNIEKVTDFSSYTMVEDLPIALKVPLPAKKNDVFVLIPKSWIGLPAKIFDKDNLPDGEFMGLKLWADESGLYLITKPDGAILPPLENPDGAILSPLENRLSRGDNFVPFLEGTILPLHTNTSINLINKIYLDNTREREAPPEKTDPVKANDLSSGTQEKEKVAPKRKFSDTTATATGMPRGNPAADDFALGEPHFDKWNATGAELMIWTVNQMQDFYEKDPIGVQQLAMMRETSGYHGPIRPVLVVFCGKYQSDPHFLRNWEKHTGKLATWMNTQSRINLQTKSKQHASSNPTTKSGILFDRPTAEKVHRQNLARFLDD